MGSWERVSDLAEEQWGLVTRPQVEARGMAWSTLSRMTRTGRIERVGHGVYRLRGTPPPDYLDLRVAWLQLFPKVPAWERTPVQGVVSHRSAAALLGVGDLPADVHEFTLPVRRQTRRPDVRLHRKHLEDGWIVDRSGLPTTRATRIVVDLLDDGAEVESVAAIAVEALRNGHDDPPNFVDVLAPYAPRFGLHDGVEVLSWLLDLTGDPDRGRWIDVVAETRGGVRNS